MKLSSFRRLIASTIIFCFIGAGQIRADELPWILNAAPGTELEIVQPFLPENPVILEAGAYDGKDSVILAKRWPLGFVYSFEPSPSSFAMLAARTAGIENIKIFPLGLFSKTGAYVFNVNTLSEGSSSLFEANDYPFYRDKPITVFCMNLDEWAASEKVQHIDYLWLDMEGAELHVLETAPKILQTVRAISTEINFREFRKGMTQFADIKTLLEKRGFTLYKMWDWGVKNWQGTAVFIRSSLIDEAQK